MDSSKRQTDRETDRQTVRLRDRQTDRQEIERPVIGLSRPQKNDSGETLLTGNLIILQAQKKEGAYGEEMLAPSCFSSLHIFLSTPLCFLFSYEVCARKKFQRNSEKSLTNS